VQLADANTASAGDVIITRQNDRRLHISATDWVMNGDRWTVLSVTRTGALNVRHARSGRIVTLSPGYVAAATQLGYATTLHTAQGVTVDTMHGFATGTESWQQLYTMLTGGLTANHLHLPRRRRRRPAHDPATREHPPPRRYRAARTDPGPRHHRTVGDHAAKQLRELDSADDRAAVLNWRLDTQLHDPAAPLRWLPGITARIATDPDWRPYLATRARLITDLADQVRTAGTPVWIAQQRSPLPADPIADIQVWRVAMQVRPADLRPTGPLQPSLRPNLAAPT
jgi:hypothetical protein